MIRFGTVSIVNHDKGTVKVHFEDLEDQSAELQVFQGRNKGTKQYSMPQIGERGLCLLVSNGNSGMYLGSGYDLPAPVMSNAGEGKTITIFSDGTQVIYDEKASKLYLDCKKEIEVVCPQIKITGDITINGNIAITGNIDLKGKLDSTESVNAAKDISAAGISLKDHTHTNVTSGIDKSGPPA